MNGGGEDDAAEAGGLIKRSSAPIDTADIIDSHLRGAFFVFASKSCFQRLRDREFRSALGSGNHDGILAQETLRY